MANPKDKDTGKGPAHQPAAGAPPDPTTGGTDTSPGDTAAQEAAAKAAADAADEEVGPGILKKINPKDVVGGNLLQMALKGDIKFPCDLYTLIGHASNLREGESAYGPWVSLKGEFEATVQVSGENLGKSFISSECFVPGPAGDLLVAAVRKFIEAPIEVSEEQYKKTGRTFRVTGEIVEMALVIGAKASDRSGGSGYEYTVRPIIKVQKADPLSGLRERTKRLMLAPPKSQTEALSKS